MVLSKTQDRLNQISIKNETRRSFMQKDLKDLFIDELHDILSSEEQIVAALPEMVSASASPELKKAFESHLKETQHQVHRLNKIFKILKIEKKEKLCKATKGLIQECKEVLNDFKTKSPARDAALISKAQRIEHYEISAYGTIRTYAHELDLDGVSDLIVETLDEEKNADKKLSSIAIGGLFKKGINHEANINITKTDKPKESNTDKHKESKKKNIKPRTSKRTASKRKSVKK